MPLGEFHFHLSFNWETEVQRDEGNRPKGSRVSQQPDQEARAVTPCFLVSSLNIRAHSLLEAAFQERRQRSFRSSWGGARYLPKGAPRSAENKSFSSKMGLSPSFTSIAQPGSSSYLLSWLRPPSLGAVPTRHSKAAAARISRTLSLEPQNPIVPQGVPKAPRVCCAL